MPLTLLVSRLLSVLFALLSILVSLLAQGRLYVILGPSGCGKTTLLSLMGGLDSPADGQIGHYPGGSEAECAAVRGTAAAGGHCPRFGQ